MYVYIYIYDLKLERNFFHRFSTWLMLCSLEYARTLPEIMPRPWPSRVSWSQAACETMKTSTPRRKPIGIQ